jgi:hypothetical protein
MVQTKEYLKINATVTIKLSLRYRRIISNNKTLIRHRAVRCDIWVENT